MDRVIGWLWKSNTQEDGAKVEETSVIKNADESKKSDSKPADKSSYRTLANTSLSCNETSVKPVFNSDKTSSAANLMQLLQRYTYLKPEDCVLCKLIATGCATLLFISGISLVSHQRNLFMLKKQLTQSRNTITVMQYGLVTAIWLVFLQKEWYNALTKPPGEEPRSFLQAAQMDLLYLSPHLTKPSETEEEK